MSDKNLQSGNYSEDIWENIGKLDDKVNNLAEFTFDYTDRSDRLDEMKFAILSNALERQNEFLEVQGEYLMDLGFKIDELITRGQIYHTLKTLAFLSLGVFFMSLVFRIWFNYDFIFTPIENQLYFRGCVLSVCFEIKPQ